MNALYELERVTGVFVQICAQIVERNGVDGYASGDGCRVNEDVALCRHVVDICHVRLLVVDVE